MSTCKHPALEPRLATGAHVTPSQAGVAVSGFSLIIPVELPFISTAFCFAHFLGGKNSNLALEVL